MPLSSQDLSHITQAGRRAALDTWRGYMTAAGFVELEHYYRPEGLPRNEQPWLASVWRKPAPG
jgi:hypothetical protein